MDTTHSHVSEEYSSGVMCGGSRMNLAGIFSGQRAAQAEAKIAWKRAGSHSPLAVPGRRRKLQV